ncbi:hypothetical protein B4N89_45055 [Embleya scabrispora]|uniref:DUF6545 domain-containing protein n=1 Tax=Embleya scabrispora TaxID=159449 RepID=A0A1T3NJ74_9ACTN|nr:hypothetical protein B4N89_45055 [Embleya scabrispora]
MRAAAAEWQRRVACPRDFGVGAVVDLHRQLFDAVAPLQVIRVSENTPTMWVGARDADYLTWPPGSALYRFHQAAQVLLKARLGPGADERCDEVARCFATGLVARMIQENVPTGWLTRARAHLALRQLWWALSAATNDRPIYRRCAIGDCAHLSDVTFRLADRITDLESKFHELRPYFDRDVADSTFKTCHMVGERDDDAIGYAEAAVVTAAVHRRRRGSRPVPEHRRIDLASGPATAGIEDEMRRILALSRAFETVSKYVRRR